MSAGLGIGVTTRLVEGLLLVLFVGLGCSNVEGPDPWERMNRKTFAFNEAADQYLIAPAASAWDFAIPEVAQTGIRNVFQNLNMPVVFVNDLLQGKPGATGDDLIRVLVNTVFGLGGLIDVASYSQVPKNDEDFGQTFGYWGVHSGPYLVLPILGPSTVCTAAGLAADTAATPYAYFIPFWLSASSTGLRVLNLRAYYLEEVEQSRRDAFDYYIFMRDAYLQNLKAKINDSPLGVKQVEDEDDLYYYDEEDGGADDDAGSTGSTDEYDETKISTNHDV